MKKILVLSTIVALFPTVVSAITYSFLAPLPGFENEMDLVPYLVSLIGLVIGVAGIIGVVRLVICGFELLTAPGESQRGHAKDCLLMVVIGLLIALASFVLLQTINPALTKPELDLPETGQEIAGGRNRPTAPGWYYAYRAARTGNEVYSQALPDQPGCQTAQADRQSQGVEITQGCFEVRPPAQGGNDYCVGGVPSGTFSQASEEGARQSLCGNASCVGSGNLRVNANFCVDTCVRGCTNLQGLPGSAISEIQRMQQACNCIVTVTGGTEYHLHVSHAANRPIFDLRKSTALDRIITAGQSAPSFGGYTKYLVNGFWYTNEGSHWHVCQEGTNTSAACQ